jgi:ribosomal protein S18 acetylase RimI-like enzyme
MNDLLAMDPQLQPGSALQLRPMLESDLPFLTALYASTREEELRPVPWPDDAKAAFLASQFALQHDHYSKHYPGASYAVVEHEGEHIGRLYWARMAGELRILDIALLPGWRGRGFGSCLMRALFRVADAEGRTVSIHVERNNPALELYRRLGFEFSEDRGVYFFLTRPARVAGQVIAERVTAGPVTAEHVSAAQVSAAQVNAEQSIAGSGATAA